MIFSQTKIGTAEWLQRISVDQEDADLNPGLSTNLPLLSVVHAQCPAKSVLCGPGRIVMNVDFPREPNFSGLMLAFPCCILFRLSS